MKNEIILVDKKPNIWTLTLNRPEKRNAINLPLLQSLNSLLDEAEQDTECRVIVICGNDKDFCTGMDFEEATQQINSRTDSHTENFDYMQILGRFASINKIIVSKVEGLVMAGGIGFVAASDLVVADYGSRFSLSEALWGLLPACVTPYLIRRVGFQSAYRMTLTTESISADEAFRIGLVDLVSDKPDTEIRRQLLRLNRLDHETIRDVKSYFKKMWLINEAMEKTAIDEINRLIKTDRVKRNITNYIEHNKFPWNF